MINEHIAIPQDEIIAFCRKYPIHKLSLFGSVLRDDFRPDSDVDVLVEFERGARVTYLDLAEMKYALEDILGRQVDLLTPGALSEYFRQHVLDTAQVVYERS